MRTITSIVFTHHGHLFRVCVALLLSAVTAPSRAQTFSATGGPLPGGATTCFPITVSGVGAIGPVTGLTEVCLDVGSFFGSFLNSFAFSLIAPDGTVVQLLPNNNGLGGTQLTNTCFQTYGGLLLFGSGFQPPFTGDWAPLQDLSAMNNGQIADGTWQICSTAGLFGSSTLNSVTLTFGTLNIPPPQPPCGTSPAAGNTCDEAAVLCTLNGYCGNTSTAYTIDSWPALSSTFSIACGGVVINNNSFLQFTATAATVSFWVWVSDCANNQGIQFLFFGQDCGSSVVTSNGCYSFVPETVTGPALVSATGLVPGEDYYLMVDGAAGDDCDYVFAGDEGVMLLQAIAAPNPLCEGQTAVLNVMGGSGNYVWDFDPSLSSTVGASVTATPDTTTTYTVTSTGANECNGIDTVTVTVIDCTPLPVTWSGISARCEGTDRVITWTVATQLNNDRFEVERSMDAQNWTEFATIPGAGTTSQLMMYSVIDEQSNLIPSAEVMYYRVKQVDMDGAYSYSPVVASVCDFLVFPNPAFDFITVASPYTGTSVRLVDAAGRIVRQTAVGIPTTRIEVRDLSAGLYAVQFLASGGLIGRAVVVKQ